ncbi:MAG: arginine--tRNA ligase [Planctomycetaceae bacterium]|nr:arginine--tRNA ligase [Planctomycetaceae bacterium]
MILNLLKERFAAALQNITDNPAEYLDLIRVSQDPKFGDFQANFAMLLAKKLGKNPRDIAAEIITNLDITGICEPPEIVCPGFVNLRLTNELLEKLLKRASADTQQLGIEVLPTDKRKTIVIDYSGPNVAKPMHVGHLRSIHRIGL